MMPPVERLVQQLDQGLRRGHFRDAVSGGRLVRELVLAYRQAMEPRPPSRKPAFEDVMRRRGVRT